MNKGSPSKPNPHLHRWNGSTLRVLQKCPSALQHVSGVPNIPANELRNCCIDSSPMPDPPKPAFPRYDPIVGSSDEAALNPGMLISSTSNFNQTHKSCEPSGSRELAASSSLTPDHSVANRRNENPTIRDTQFTKGSPTQREGRVRCRKRKYLSACRSYNVHLSI